MDREGRQTHKMSRWRHKDWFANIQTCAKCAEQTLKMPFSLHSLIQNSIKCLQKTTTQDYNYIKNTIKPILNKF